MWVWLWVEMLQGILYVEDGKEEEESALTIL